MKTSLRVFLLATIAVATCVSFKSYAVTDTVQSEVVLVEAAAIECGSTKLNFGSLNQNQAGTVTITPAGTRTSTNSALLVAGAAGNPAECYVSGAQNYNIALTAASSSVVNGMTSMAINTFSFKDSNSPAGPGPYTAALGTVGDETVKIGANLVVVGNEPSGTYRGTIVVTALYE